MNVKMYNYIHVPILYILYYKKKFEGSIKIFGKSHDLIREFNGISDIKHTSFVFKSVHQNIIIERQMEFVFPHILSSAN